MIAWEISKGIEYAKRAKREGDIALHRFYLRKTRAFVDFYTRCRDPDRPGDMR